MAAPTLVASSIVTGQASSHVSSSLTVQAGDVVTILASEEGASAGESFTTPTTTLTPDATGIVQLQLHAASSNCAGGGWTFTIGTGGTGTVTLGLSAGAGSKNFVLAVLVDRGGTAATATRSALGVGSSRTVSYTPSQADSAIHWIVGDWNASNTVAETPTSTTHSTSSPGPSALPQSAKVAGVYTEYVSSLDDQTSTGAVSYGIGGSGTGPFTIIVVEVQGTGGATGATVNAVAATASDAAVAPVVTGGATVSAVAGTVTVAANAPTVSTALNGTVNAVAATASTAAVAPTVAGGATVTGVKAATSSAAVAPVVAGGASVTGIKATASTAANAPAVTGGAAVTSVKATVSVAALAPIVTGGASGDANVAAVKATTALAARAPVVTGGSRITAVKATVTTAAVAATVAVSATVSAVKATVATSAYAPSVLVPDARVGAVAATLTLIAVAPRVSAVEVVYTFTPPTVTLHYSDDPLGHRIAYPTGTSVLKIGGFYQQLSYPPDDELISSAEVAYLGGHTYTIHGGEKDALTAAGYGSYITEVTP